MINQLGYVLLEKCNIIEDRCNTAVVVGFKAC